MNQETRQTLVRDSVIRELLNAAPDGILVSAIDGQILIANTQCCELFGYETSELVGMSIDQLVPNSVRPHHGNLRHQFFAHPHKRPMGAGLELFGQKQDGTTIPVEISLSPFELDGVSCAIAIVRDVTEARKLARELRNNNIELKRSNDDLDQFAAIASHDLQEPLRMIGGYTQLLARRYQGKLDQDAHEYIDYALEGVKRLQNLIQDLLTYSRLSTRARPFTELDTNDVLAQVLSNLQLAIEEQQAVVEATNLPKIHGDSIQITQLLQNLISNALKFRDPLLHPEIRITCERGLDSWIFHVADNGIGIAREYHEKIFEIFQRLHSRETYPGTGIGLAICKRIVERHGGKIFVNSAAQEVTRHGTTFTFTIPFEPPKGKVPV